MPQGMRRGEAVSMSQSRKKDEGGGVSLSLLVLCGLYSLQLISPEQAPDSRED